MIVSIDETRKNHVSGQVHSPNLRHSAPGTIGGWSVAESPIYNRELGGEGGGSPVATRAPVSRHPATAAERRMACALLSRSIDLIASSILSQCPNRGETGE